MTHKVIFDSAKFPEGEIIGLACGFSSLSEILFANENITIYIEAKTGNIDFYDAESNKALSTKIDVPRSGDEKYSEVKCIVEAGIIKLGFPQYSYEDNYPNCDGEYDRWTKIISGFSFLCYDIKNNRIIE